MTETCPACNGQKIQLGHDGIMVRCPACDGAGVWRKSNPDNVLPISPLPYQPIPGAWPLTPPYRPYGDYPWIQTQPFTIPCQPQSPIKGPIYDSNPYYRMTFTSCQ